MLLEEVRVNEDPTTLHVRTFTVRGLEYARGHGQGLQYLLIEFQVCILVLTPHNRVVNGGPGQDFLFLYL